MAKTGRPVIVPRGPITPFGRVLRERNISSRTLGEALAIAEGKERQVETQLVNRWVWGKQRPSPDRQELIAQMLKLPVGELFPPITETRPQTELDLLAAAARSRRPPRPRAPAAGAAHLERASAQETLKAASTTGDVPCSIERKRKRRARAKPPAKAASRKAA